MARRMARRAVPSDAGGFPSPTIVQPPAEADFQRFFCVTPPSVHQMIIQLERLGFIRRTPRQARSIELLVPAEELPQHQPIKTSVARY